jgi:hypothetical protein
VNLASRFILLGESKTNGFPMGSQSHGVERDLVEGNGLWAEFRAGFLKQGRFGGVETFGCVFHQFALPDMRVFHSGLRRPKKAQKPLNSVFSMIWEWIRGCS